MHQRGKTKMTRKHNTGNRKKISSSLLSAKLRASLLAKRHIWGKFLLLAQRPLWGFFLLLTSSFLLSSCSQSSSPKEDTVTFSGTITLEDTTDFSGVKVSLYKPVELDTALVRINQEYPNIGVQISQETEFNHRRHEPLHTTQTKTGVSEEIEVLSGI
jgi:hypothetical protein